MKNKKREKKHQLFKYRSLLFLLVRKDLKIKYKGSFLGYLWSLLDPILNMLVLTVVFSSLFHSQIENYPVYLLSGRIIFQYLSSSGGTGMKSIVSNAHLLQKTKVPQYLFCLSKATGGMVDIFFEMVALVVVMLLTGVPFTINLVYIPVILIPVYIFTLGFGMFLAQAAVFFRDLFYVYSVFTSIWMYLTPLFYPITSLPPKLQQIEKVANPAYIYIYNFRRVVLEGTGVDWMTWGYGMILALVMLLVGVLCFNARKKEFIYYL